MKIAHVLTDGVVVNSIALADDAVPIEFGAVIGPASAGIGWGFDGTTWTPPTATEPTLDEQLAAIETAFEAKKASFALQLSTVVLVDGSTEATKTAELQAAYVAACNEKAAAIDALLFGGL